MESKPWILTDTKLNLHMKKIIYFVATVLLTTFMGCTTENDNLDYLNNVANPANISALFTITNDNSGKVTIQPNGEGVSYYTVYYGDNTAQPGKVLQGEKIQHTYAEGQYTVKIIATTVNGKTTEYRQPLTVSFIAPTDLVVTATAETGNPYKINVTAKANFETHFAVFFGEVPNEVPVQFNEGQTVSHTYATVGIYTLKVIAYSGGAATTQYTQTINVFDPLLLPINFESTSLNYTFANFGGASALVANNPSIGGVNPSAKVAKLTKSNGAEVWGGSLLILDQPIDFSVLKKIKIKSFSPKVGAVIKLKVENLTDGNINKEVDVVTTVANQWENLVFDFTGINTSNTYQKVVVFYDFGVNGTGSNYYFDDIKQTNANAVLELPLTFQDNSLTYNYGNFGGVTANVITNPDQTGINTSTKVTQLVKAPGAEVWAGCALTLDQTIDFSVLHKIKIKVWSPKIGADVLFKIENGVSADAIEKHATTTIANGWEELTYDFTGVDNSKAFKTVVVFCDFGVAGTGSTYYFDDINLSN